MTRQGTIAAALCALLAACGGGGGGGSAGNAAAGKSFTYGVPGPASPAQRGAGQSAAATALSLRGTPTANGAASFADITTLTAAILGDSAFTLVRADPAGQPGLAVGSWREAAAVRAALTGTIDPQCVTTTDTSVAFRACAIPIATSTAHGTIRLDGSFSLGADRQTLDWSLTLAGQVTISSPDASGSGTIAYHESGTLTVTATAIQGKMLAELGVTARATTGETDALAVHEALLLDLTYQSAPSLCVTGGTLEAKRVWTTRPSGATPADLPDEAARITFTGCNAATVAFGH